jgi:DNA-binding winged helix-turn-helix (wHTH) protein
VNYDPSCGPRVLKKFQEFPNRPRHEKRYAYDRKLVRVKIRFGPFTLDSETRQLRNGGSEVHLPRKAFELLSTLLARRPKVVDKDELRAELWPDSHVDAAGLNVLIGDLRRALGDAVKRPQFIRTVHGVGYAFCGDAIELGEAPASARTPCWLVLGERTLPLADGENVIGRDPGCDVWLDAPGVSRRHAAIAINLVENRVLLRDLGSTNGTFLGRVRITEPAALSDGDAIKMGTVVLKFRQWFPERAVETRRIRKRAKNTPP